MPPSAKLDVYRRNSMKERFSERARNAMALANLEASKLNHDYLAPFHLMLGTLSGGECLATTALNALHANPDDARRRVLEHVEKGQTTGSVARRAQTKEMKEVISLAIGEARKLGHRYVGTEHLMLALCEYEKGIPAKVLHEMGIAYDALRDKILSLLDASDAAAEALTTGTRGEYEWVHQQELAKAFRSPKFWHTLILAVDSANQLGAGEIEPAHLLLAILRDEGTGMQRLLAEKGVTAEWVQDQLGNDH
jgi:ATP-dependent Clp protease ATP-binding subunit ClpA